MSESQPILRAEAVTYGFPQRPDFLQPVSIAIRAGEFWSFIGPNGAGKSTLLRILAGLWTPRSGSVLLQGRSLAHTSALERARRISFLPQHLSPDPALSADALVLMGRHPHRRFGLFESAADYDIAQSAMIATQTKQFAGRPLSTLSGGEAQRVHIAAALAQEPAVFLLDEPTASLDLHHQMRIFELLQRLTREQSLAVVVVSHDVNLAARFSTHVLLLHDGRTIAKGPPESVVRPDLLEPVYDVSLAPLQIPGIAAAGVVPLQSSRAGGGTA